jgi:hypothetical protein
MTDPSLVTWRKSSRSGGNNGQCVEVGHGVGIRDSKKPDGAIIRVAGTAWSRFLAAAKAGTFDE